MRYAILSDIHANLEAFTATLSDIENQACDLILCLGDMVGYGPDPERVIQLIRNQQIPSILGNHEMAIKEPAVLDWFNPLAQTSLRKTIDLLSDQSLTFIRNLEAFRVIGNARLVHGFPPDSATTYLFQMDESHIATVLGGLAETICFVGHTHLIEIIAYDGRRLLRSPLAHNPVQLESACRYLINAGSVGQPRDGNNNAKYLIWDDKKQHVQLRYVPYDIAAVVAKIGQRGLPEAHARRLW